MSEGFERDSKGPTKYLYGMFTDMALGSVLPPVNLIHCTRLIQS